MNLKRNLFILFSITLFSIASTVLCISNYNPFEASVPEFIQFYASLFFAISGLVSLVIYFAKLKFTKNKTLYSSLTPSVRQGLFVGVGITLIIFLQGMNLFDPWTAIPMIVILILLELFFQTKNPIIKKSKI